MIVWKVRAFRNFTKAWLRCAENQLFQSDPSLTCEAEILHQGNQLYVGILLNEFSLPDYRPVNIVECKFCTKIKHNIKMTGFFYLEK